MSSTKERILASASALFRKQGYHATTLNQISSASQTPRGSVYYYFPNGKEQLANEAIIRTGFIVKERIQMKFTKKAPIADLFYEHIISLADEIKSPNDNSSIFSLISISREISESSELLLQTCKTVYDSWTDCFYLKLLEENYTPIDAFNLSIIIQSMIEGAYAFVVSHQDEKAMYIVAEHISHILSTK